MKTMMIMLTAGLLLGAFTLPMVTASETACGRADESQSLQAIAHPVKSDSYLFLDMTQPDKVGEWTEKNKATGLQTVACFRFNIFRYGPDDHASVLG